MANFIEFTTRHRERTYGNPVYNGKLKRFRDVDGVRVDGEPVEFRDTTIPHRLERYLVMSRRQRINDCVAFVALMNSISFSSKNNPFQDFNRSKLISPNKVDLASKEPLVLVQDFHDMSIPKHVILPAHTQERQNYLHKLGDRGPLCMSNLRDSMRIMECTKAHPVAG